MKEYEESDFLELEMLIGSTRHPPKRQESRKEEDPKSYQQRISVNSPTLASPNGLMADDLRSISRHDSL